MKSLHRQAGWYTGALMFTLVMAIVLFVSQPWIPLALLTALIVALAVIGVSHGMDSLKHWYQDHHTHAH